MAALKANVQPRRQRAASFGLLHAVGGEAGVRASMQQNRPAEGADRWENGYEYAPDPCNDVRGVEDPCDMSALTPTELPDVIGEDAFVMRESLQCSTLGNDHESLMEKTQRSLLQSTSRRLETALWSGSGLTTERFLADGDTTIIDSGTAHPFLHAFALVQDALAAELDGAPGMIHTRVRLASKLFTFGAAYVANGQLVDSFGNIIVGGTGYPGTAPTGEDAPTAAQSWMIGSSDIDIRLSDVEVEGNRNTSVDRTSNIDIATAIRFGGLTYVCSPQAVLVDECTVNC
jgi:hypothetical protein